MNEPSPTPRSTEPFTSITAVQSEYLQLSVETEVLERAASEVDDKDGEEVLQKLVLLRRRIRRFERRAAATGAVLDEKADRDLTQSMLDHWSLRQVYLERLSRRLRERLGSARKMPLLESAPRLRDPLRLAPFDETSAPQLPDKPSPFVGLNAFGADEGDWAIFFGRDEAVAELQTMLRDHRLVVVSGPSGSGKSSLIMAGLLPRLRIGGVEGSADWFYWPPVLPGVDPFAALLQSVRPSKAEMSPWVSRHRAALERSPESLVSIMAGIGESARPSLLIVDQIEELFSMVEDARTRAAFARAIVAPSLSADPAHRVIVVVREDFVDELLELEAFTSLSRESIVRFCPKPMTSAELRLAIEEPARAMGLKFDEGIVEDLVREVVNDPAALPLLQFTLTQLWRKRRRNRITREVYAKVGRPADALGRTAERVFEKLNTQQNQAAAKDIFLALVVPSVGAEFVRRRVRREVLHTLRDSSQIDRVLEAFVAAGLIRRIEGVEAADDRFDVMHEALLRNWPRLTGWLEEKLRTGARHRQVLDRARIWDQSGRVQDHLAIGTAVAEAELFASEDLLVREYFEASRSHAEKLARERRWAWVGMGIFTLIVVSSLVVAAMWSFWTNQWRDRLYLDQARADEANYYVARLKQRAENDRSRLEGQLESSRAQFNEVIAAGTPSLRASQQPIAFPARAPGVSGVAWIGSPESPLISLSQDLTPVPPDGIRAGALYRARANLALREDFPLQPEYKSADRRFRDGTVAAGSLIVALEPPKGYDRPPGTQYWLRMRIVPRVIIRYPAGSGGESAAEIGRIVGSLRAAGYDAVGAEPIPAARSESELRYFYGQDQAVANVLKERLRTLLDPQHPAIPIVSRMQSAIRPDPGTLELWLDPSVPPPDEG